MAHFHVIYMFNLLPIVCVSSSISLVYSLLPYTLPPDDP